MALLVIAGTSGAGKGAIVSRLRQQFPDLWYSVSMTTRPRRPNEVDGEDYLFVDREEFERLRAKGGFLESYEVYGELKGTPRQPIDERLARAEDVLMELDVQGALKVKELFPEAVLVFVRAPSTEEQRRRLMERANEEGLDVEARLAAAQWEESLVEHFDHVIVNDDLDEAVKHVAAILSRSRSGA